MRQRCQGCLNHCAQSLAGGERAGASPIPQCSGTRFSLLCSHTAGPMNKLKGLSQAVLESDEGKEMGRLFDSLLAAMKQYEAAKFAEWCSLTATVSEQKLKQPLFRWG